MRSLASGAFHALLPVVLLFSGCDSATPVAPVGSTLTISANPAQIVPTGSSNITVVARKTDGSPVNPGTEIIFSATLGSIEPSVRTDELGVASATLVGDGRIGTSTITALSGAADSASVEVQVGSSAGSITLQSTPTFVTETGGELDLLAVVRDEAGQLLPNAAVNFGADRGTLASGGSAVFTDEAGSARDVLTVTAEDIEGFDDEAATFQARAQTAGSDGLIIEATFDIAVERLAPVAAFEAVEGGDCVIVFTNTTTGREPILFEWDFDGDGDLDSSVRNPSFDYSSLVEDSDGDGTKCPDDPDLPDDDPATDSTQTFVVTLTASNDLGTDTAVQTVAVDPN